MKTLEEEVRTIEYIARGKMLDIEPKYAIHMLFDLFNIYGFENVKTVYEKIEREF